MKNTIIISGFPGIGKSFVCEKYRDSDIIISDSDSSLFSWLEPGVRNPEFPNNYVEHIIENIGKVDYILISSHDIVRKALAERGIQYILVYPDISLRDEYINRYIQRGSSEEFINNIKNTFEEFVYQCENDEYAIKIKLNSDIYLLDIIDVLGGS